MSTKHTSFIPMSPSARPQQHIYEVVTIPELPKRLDPRVEIDQPLLKNYPKNFLLLNSILLYFLHLLQYCKIL